MTAKPLLKTLSGVATEPPPIWLMRQAGRYLPEYRAIRKESGDFLDLCFDSERAAEITLQPVRRFDLDAAIIFADILLLPLALGQQVRFAPGGPQLSAVRERDLQFFRRQDIHRTLGPVYETVRKTKAALGGDKSVIGFAGAPWTVATYMLGGGAQKDPSALRARWYEDKQFIGDLLDVLSATTIEYLVGQIDAGADAVQLFESWASGLPEDVFNAVSLAPIRRIAEGVKEARPNTPLILFAKGAGVLSAAYARLNACDAIGIDYATPWSWARANLSPHAVVQGGLDPLLLVEGGMAMKQAALELCSAFKGTPYIFNLGHGILPETPPDNVAELVRYVREGASGIQA